MSRTLLTEFVIFSRLVGVHVDVDEHMHVAVDVRMRRRWLLG